MKFVKLGRSGLKVSRLCLGTMTFGKMNDEKEAFAIMDRAQELGINFFDTSNNYGGGVGYRGRVETILGTWFAQGGGRREKTVLNSKCFMQVEEELDGPNDADGTSAYKIRRSLERSLQRLRTDHLEMYTIHHVDRDVTYDEIWGTYEALINQGKVFYAATSNFAGRDLVKAQYEAKNRHFFGIIAEQHKYNLNCRLPELEVLPAARDMGIAMMTYSPLSGGFLGENALNPKPGTRAAGNNLYSDFMGDYSVGIYQDRIVKFDLLCKKIGEKQSDVALAWLLHNPMVDVPIIGPRTLEQLENTMHALEIELDDEILKELDEIFPGPGCEAPRAYAW